MNDTHLLTVDFKSVNIITEIDYENHLLIDFETNLLRR
jgi:hypothetical protein